MKTPHSLATEVSGAYRLELSNGEWEALAEMISRAADAEAFTASLVARGADEVLRAVAAERGRKPVPATRFH